MKKTFEKSEARRKILQHYTSFSAAFLALAAPVSGQVVYTDVEPDLNVFIDDVALDMNGDGTNDFKIVFLSESFASFGSNELKLRINPLGDNQVAFSMQTVPVTYLGTPWYTYEGGATQLLFTNIPLLNAGTEVNNAIDFHLDIGVLYEKLFFYIYTSSNLQAFEGGVWNGTTDHFAAVTLDIDGALHYGWMRLNVSTETGITLLDYAYELMPETPITTAIKNYSTAWISVEDGGISESANDLLFNFSAAGDEVDISAYRVICVKSGNDFSLDDAEALSADRYVEIIPDGSPNYNLNFPSGAVDSDGDLIVAGLPYVLFVHNIMLPATNYLNILSQPSNEVILVDTVSVVTDLTIADVNNNGNGTDIRVNFNAPEIIQGIEEYRIIIAQKDAADVFTIEDALLLTPYKYTIVTPGPESHEIFLTGDVLDSDGNIIQPGRYKAFVLSVPDGSTVANFAMTPVSNVISLEKATAQVPFVNIEDIGENGNGADINISFIIPEFEQTIDKYRVYLVDFATAFDFDVNAALASSHYFEITPTGTDINITADATTKDSEGNLITWGVPYYAYVLSMASEYGIGDTLSAPSNQLILNFPVGINQSAIITDVPTIFTSANQIHIEYNQNANSVFELYQITGQLLFTEQLNQNKSTISTQLPQGIYLARLKLNGTWFYEQIKL